MLDRIVAAWKVLRGEWTARPPEPTFTVYWNGVPCAGYYASNGSDYVANWTVSSG